LVNIDILKTTVFIVLTEQIIK